MPLPMLVLDANILIRAVLGNKVRGYLLSFNNTVDFLVPDVCVEEAKKYLPIIFEKRGLSPSIAMDVFINVMPLLEIIDEALYQEYETEAKQRMKKRDLDDWPTVATALLFDCPIWTEDQDFFGVGIPVWKTDSVPLFFDSLKARPH